MNVNLSYEELQIIIQTMEQFNYSGKDVRQVGLLMDKLIQSCKKLEEKNKQ